MGVGTLVFELGLVTVLFSKTARRVLVPIVALFHLAILLSMNLTFLNVPQLLVFADWDVVAAWVKRQQAKDAGKHIHVETTRSTA
jgi:hypothetical protein